MIRNVPHYFNRLWSVTRMMMTIDAQEAAVLREVLFADRRV